MTEVFLHLVSMSLSASWMVLAILLLRFVLKKAPKWINPALWSLVALRLLLPFSIKSQMSLIPQMPATYKPDIVSVPDLSAPSAPVSPQAGASFPSENVVSDTMTSISTSLSIQDIFAVIWGIGVLILLTYAVVTYLRLHRKLSTAVRLQGTIYESEFVQSPFILGIFRPKIYLPSGLDTAERQYVLSHERAHLNRLDHLWKPFGFFLLSVYWFNPILWIAYVVLCRDIELACDEKVIRNMSHTERAEYSQTLLNCSSDRRQIAACPLAFGEVGVKERVKSVLNYRKPALWIILAAAAASVAVAVCFLTDPVEVPMNFSEDPVISAFLSDWRDSNAEANTHIDPQAPDSVPLRDTDLDDEHFRELKVDEIYFITQYLENISDFKKTNRNIIPDCDYSVLLKTENSSVYTIAAYEEDTSVYLTTPQGTYLTDAPELYGYISYICLSETEKLLCWYDPALDDTGSPSAVDLPEFPGTVFTLSFGTNGAEDVICAVEGTETRELIRGLPIENIYFADLNGDDKREICATVSYGSGLVDSRVRVYDYANSAAYELEHRGTSDYVLSHADIKLTVEEYQDGHLVQTGKLVLTDKGLVMHDPISAAMPDPPKDNFSPETVDASIDEAIQNTLPDGSWQIVWLEKRGNLGMMAAAKQEDAGAVLYSLDSGKTWTQLFLSESGFDSLHALDIDFQKIDTQSLCVCFIFSDGAYAEGLGDTLYHRFLNEPEEVLNVLVSLMAWEIQDQESAVGILCREISGVNHCWYDDDPVFHELLDTCQEKHPSGEKADILTMLRVAYSESVKQNPVS